MKLFFAIAMLAAAPLAHASASLDDVLRNMDAASAKFRAMAADVEWTTYTKLVDDTSVEKGTLLVRRRQDRSADLRITFTDPYPKDLLIRGTAVEIYKPKIATVEEYDLSKSKDKLDQALLLGFGPSGKTLRENYEVKLLGEEEAAGEPTVRLELVPKSEESRKSMPKLEMWVSKKTWQPVRQKLYQDLSGDYRLYTYTAIRLNPAVKDADFKLDLPKKVKRISPK